MMCPCERQNHSKDLVFDFGVKSVLEVPVCHSCSLNEKKKDFSGNLNNGIYHTEPASIFSV